MIPQLFLDLDGVLADFDKYYFDCFGDMPSRDAGSKAPRDMWKNIHKHGSFYRDLPMTPDGMTLFRGAYAFHPNPIILTGVPHEDPKAETHKREWVARHLGLDVPVIGCKSKDKRLHGKPGDVLCDDWLKYRHLWEEMGGVFILHTSAVDTLRHLQEVYQP